MITSGDGNLVEIVPIADTYADDIGAVEVLGSNVRVTFYTIAGFQREWVVVAKMVLPLCNLERGKLYDMVQRDLGAIHAAAALSMH